MVVFVTIAADMLGFGRARLEERCVRQHLNFTIADAQLRCGREILNVNAEFILTRLKTD